MEFPTPVECNLNSYIRGLVLDVDHKTYSFLENTFLGDYVFYFDARKFSSKFQ